MASVTVLRPYPADARCPSLAPGRWKATLLGWRASTTARSAVHEAAHPRARRGASSLCSPDVAQHILDAPDFVEWEVRFIFKYFSSVAVLPDKLGSNERTAVRFYSLWQESTEIQFSRFGKWQEKNQAVKGAPI